MNERPSHPDDLALHVAPWSPAGPVATEPPISAATAAHWRRHFRGQDVLTPPPDEPDHPDQARVTSNPATIGSSDTIARDSVELQRAGLTTMVRIPTDSMFNAVIDRPVVPTPRGIIRRDESAPIKEDADRQPSSNSNNKFAHISELLLIAILTVQAVLSLRLVWSNTAFLDEAINILAGHAEIAHWLHGTPVPAYSTYFSGAPVIYPPIAAAADSISGLAGARFLSLLFMLGTTSLLWSTTSRLFGRRAGVCAAALFAILGPTQMLGAFATFDAMALFLLAASAWCLVTARNRDDSAFLLLAGIVLLALANATMYATVLFDPSVAVLSGLVIASRRGTKAAVGRIGYVAAGALGLISAFLAIGGPGYLAGVLHTTVSRSAGNSQVLEVLADWWNWIGLIWVIAGIGIIFCCLRARDRVQVLLLAVLIVSGILAPLDQDRIHTVTSLPMYIDFGAWFVAAAAGYAISELARLGRWKFLYLPAMTCALAAVAVPAGMAGTRQAWKIFHEWPNSSQLIVNLHSVVRHRPGQYLADDYSVPAYYLENTIPWERWSSTWHFSYTPRGTTHPLTGLAAYRAAFNRHYFSLVIIDFSDTVQTDNQIIADMQQAGGYQVIKVALSSVGQYTIWAYEPYQQPASSRGHH
jgi:MFS family permease